MSSTALAYEPRTLVVGVGDCTSRELTKAVSKLEELMLARLGRSAFPGRVAIDLARPTTERTREQLMAQAETARSLFYSGQVDQAYDLAQLALRELQRLRPSVDTWPVVVESLLVQALVFRNRSDAAGEIAVLRRIARLDKARILEPTLFAPSLIKGFEQAKRDVAKRSKLLTIKSTFDGTQVYLDGKHMGITPFSQVLPVGDYQLVLATDTQVSFSHDIKLAGPVDKTIDFAFEGAVSLAEPACITTDETHAVEWANRFGESVGIERVAVVSLGKPSSFTIQTLVDGHLERTGSVDAANLNLAVDFVVEGKPLPTEPKPTATLVAAPPALAPLAEPMTVAPTAPVTRIGPLATIIAGGVITLVSAVFAGVGRSTYSQVYDSRQTLTFDRAFSQYAQARDFTNAGLGALAGGLAVTAVGIVWLILSAKP